MTTIDVDQPIIETPRLRLRRLERGDAAVINLYASDLRVARMTTTIPHPNPPGNAEAFVARVSAPGAVETVWAIDSGGDQENGLIGLISLRAKAAGVAEIGYWVAPAFWNAGFASEAVEAVVSEADRRELSTLTAQVFQDNIASIRVLTRAGFAYVGAGEAHSIARGAMAPTFRYRRESGRAA